MCAFCAGTCSTCRQVLSMRTPPHDVQRCWKGLIQGPLRTVCNCDICTTTSMLRQESDVMAQRT